MKIDAKKIMGDKKYKKVKNKKALSFIGSIFSFLFLDFIGQIVIPPLIIGIALYFYLK